MIVKIHSSFKSLISDALTLDVKYENLQYQPELNQSFGIFQLGDVATERQSQGRCGNLNYSGTATLIIKTAIKVGAAEAYTLADQLIDFIMSNGLYSGLKMIDPPYVGASEQEFDWFVVPVYIPFQRDG